MQAGLDEAREQAAALKAENAALQKSVMALRTTQYVHGAPWTGAAATAVASDRFGLGQALRRAAGPLGDAGTRRQRDPADALGGHDTSSSSGAGSGGGAVRATAGGGGAGARGAGNGNCDGFAMDEEALAAELAQTRDELDMTKHTLRERTTQLKILMASMDALQSAGAGAGAGKDLKLCLSISSRCICWPCLCQESTLTLICMQISAEN